MTATGIKNIVITATTRYPIVSAYEYEFLKGEEEIQRRMSGCTIYFILQRPLMYFNSVREVGRTIKFDIVDTVHKPLHATLDLDLFVKGGACEVEYQFYKATPDKASPRNDVAALKIRDGDGKFVVWETPQKLLYEALANGLAVRFTGGNIADFLTYDIHYIGKAFSQKVWKRLTGHEKMQKILTLEPALATANANVRAPFEISLLMLDIIGVTEGNMFPYMEAFRSLLPQGVKPIKHKLRTEDDYAEFMTLKIDTSAPELTSEVEGFLVHRFKPKYNERKFEKYPEIRKGTRSLGYTYSQLIIEKIPVVLRTEHFTQGAIGVP